MQTAPESLQYKETATSKELESARADGAVVSALNPGDSVVVLLYKEPNLYLIRDSGGLVGWSVITNVLKDAPDIEGLYFVGD